MSHDGYRRGLNQTRQEMEELEECCLPHKLRIFVLWTQVNDCCAPVRRNWREGSRRGGGGGSSRGGGGVVLVVGVVGGGPGQHAGTQFTHPNHPSSPSSSPHLTRESAPATHNNPIPQDL